MSDNRNFSRNLKAMLSCPLGNSVCSILQASFPCDHLRHQEPARSSIYREHGMPSGSDIVFSFMATALVTLGHFLAADMMGSIMFQF